MTFAQTTGKVLYWLGYALLFAAIAFAIILILDLVLVQVKGASYSILQMLSFQGLSQSIWGWLSK